MGVLQVVDVLNKVKVKKGCTLVVDVLNKV